jgi:antitoxin FitA
LDAVAEKGLPGRKAGFGLRLSGSGIAGLLLPWEEVGRSGAAQSPKPKSRSRVYAINAISAIIDGMASITIRKLPENTKRRLRIRAARNGRSMEQEARELLETGLARADSEPENLGEAIRRRFAPLGGVDLKIPPRRGRIREIQFK